MVQISLPGDRPQANLKLNYYLTKFLARTTVMVTGSGGRIGGVSWSAIVFVKYYTH